MDNTLREMAITLSHGNQRAVVSPYGAALRRYYLIEADGSETDIVWGYGSPDDKKGGQGDVLIPFPSRIRGGRYEFEGKTYQLPLNDKAGGNAIHGFLREVKWDFTRENDMEVFFHARIRADEYADKGYPFSLDVTVNYDLMETGLTVDFEIQNVGDSAAPVGVGFHPYFVVGTETVDGVEAQIPARKYLEFEKTLVPTGNLLPVEGSDLDFRGLRQIGDTVIDNCFTDLIRNEQGLASATLHHPETGRLVRVWADSNFPYLVVFTGDTIPAPHNRRALAIEPQTCATDAFNRPDWGLKVLQPGERFEGEWGVYCQNCT